MCLVEMALKNVKSRAKWFNIKAMGSQTENF